MARITYKQARTDHAYLWSLGPAYDMTGGYVDSKDLTRLIESPTKATATEVLCDQICYWFQVGTEEGVSASHFIETNNRVRKIHERYT